MIEKGFVRIGCRRVLPWTIASGWASWRRVIMSVWSKARRLDVRCFPALTIVSHALHLFLSPKVVFNSQHTVCETVAACLSAPPCPVLARFFDLIGAHKRHNTRGSNTPLFEELLPSLLTLYHNTTCWQTQVVPNDDCNCSTSSSSRPRLKKRKNNYHFSLSWTKMLLLA